MTTTDSSKASDMHDLSQTPCFFSLSEMQDMISFVRQTAFVLAGEHPSGTKFVNFPQVQRFLDKSDVKSLICSSSPAVFQWL